VEAPVCLNNDAPKKYESPANKPSVKKKEVVEVSDEVQLEPQPEISTPAPTSSRNLEFRVQFMMSKNKISAKTFSDKGLSDVFEYRDGGYYKYATSNGYATEEEAQVQKDKIRSMGYPDAFVVTFQNGRRIK